MTASDTIILRSAGKLVLTGEPLEPDVAFRQRILEAFPDSLAARIAGSHELDALGARRGLIRKGCCYEANEISVEKPITAATFERLRKMAIDFENALLERCGSREEAQQVELERKQADRDIDALEQLWLRTEEELYD
jgi:hypothetical protein